jgi:serine protease Do
MRGKMYRYRGISLHIYFTILIAAFYMLPVIAADDLQQQILTAKNKVLPALVHIEPVKEVYTAGKKVKVQVTGSGIIFSPLGYVLTNNHVAEKAKQVQCTLANREEVPAEVIGLDVLTDLAVLKLDLSGIESKSIPYVTFGNSDNLEVGQMVLALGSPLGLSRSLSMGVISCIDRYFEDSEQMISPFNLWIQTDAAINPGNSGGPLVNLKGEVIGINARAILFGENLGFAIPINTAKLVIERILKDKTVERSWIGTEWQEIKEYRKYIQQPKLEGVLLSFVEKGSPAEKSGLQAGDLIYGIDSRPVSAVYKEELPKVRKLIAEIPVGSTITFSLLRNQMHKEIQVPTSQRGKFDGNEFVCDRWGFSVEEITPRIARNLNLPDETGVLVSGVLNGSLADEADVSRGQVVKQIDNERIANLDTFKEIYQQIKEIPAKGIMLQLYQRNAIRYALLREK